MTRAGPGLAQILAASLAAAALGAATGTATAVPPLLIVMGLLIVVATIVVVARPDLAVPCALFLLFTDAPVVAAHTQGAPVAVSLVVPLLLCLPVARNMLAGQRPIVDPVFGGLLALLLVAGASTAISLHQDVAIDHLITFVIEGPVLYVLALNACRTPEALRWAALAIVAAGAFLALVTVAQALTGTFDRPWMGFAPLDRAYFSGHGTSPRAPGPVGDANYFAQMLLPGLALALVFALRERRRIVRLACGASGVLILLAIGYTGSRGAAIALGALVIVAASVGILNTRHLLPLFLAFVALLAIMPEYRNRILSLGASGVTAQSGESVDADTSTRSRATESIAAFLAYRDHAVLGVGPGVFPLYYQRYAARVGIEVQESTRTGAQAGEAPDREAHNLFIGMAADLGSIGLLAFAGTLIVAIARLALARRRLLDHAREHTAAIAAGLFAGILAYLVAGLFLSLAYERFFWALLGLAGAAVALARDDSSAPALRRYQARSATRGSRSRGEAPSTRQKITVTTTAPDV
jgi:O-antigen ligase